MNLLGQTMKAAREKPLELVHEDVVSELFFKGVIHRCEDEFDQSILLGLAEVGRFTETYELVNTRRVGIDDPPILGFILEVQSPG